MVQTTVYRGYMQSWLLTGRSQVRALVGDESCNWKRLIVVDSKWKTLEIYKFGHTISGAPKGVFDLKGLLDYWEDPQEVVKNWMFVFVAKLNHSTDWEANVVAETFLRSCLSFLSIMSF